MEHARNPGFSPAKCFIGGEWVTPEDGKTLPIENPSTGQIIGELARGRAADIDAAVAAARHALKGEWGRKTAVERGRILTRIGQLVLDHIDLLAKLEAADVGKPLSQARIDSFALAS